MENSISLNGVLKNLLSARSEINEIEKLLLIISSKDLDYYWLLDDREYILSGIRSDVWADNIVVIKERDNSTKNWITIRQFSKNYTNTIMK